MVRYICLFYFQRGQTIYSYAKCCFFLKVIPLMLQQIKKHMQHKLLNQRRRMRKHRLETGTALKREHKIKQ